MNRTKKSTKTTLYLLPGLLTSINTTQKRLQELGFLNAYLGDKSHDNQHTHCIYLLFEVRNPIVFGDFIESMDDKVVDEYDHNGHTILVFSYPIKYIANYDYFLDGKYSKFTTEYRDLFSREPSMDDKMAGLTKSVFHCVFTKASQLKTVLENIVGEPIPEGSELATKPGNEEYMDHYFGQLITALLPTGTESSTLQSTTTHL